MKNSLIIVLFVAILSSFFATIAYGQDQLWSVDLKEELNTVSWIEQANDGTIIAAGDKGLMGLNHQDGSVKWKLNELKAIDRNTFLNVDGMPIFYVEYSPLVGKRRGIIINADDGTIHYDTKEDEIRIKEYTLLPEQNSLLFEAMKGDDRFLLNFDLSDLTVKWQTPVGANKGLGAKIKDVARGRKTFLTQGPIIDKAGNLIVGIKDEIYTIDYATGDVKWNQETPKKIKALVYSPANNSLYLGIRKEKRLTVLDPSNGNDITPGKLKLKGTMLDVISDNTGNLVLVETEGFNLIKPSTNDFVWKKNYSLLQIIRLILNKLPCSTLL
ncbi:MAG: PQQ-binding-like beta-propeller repeat protein [Bacteroidota bacterium]